jgi:hypothetical protein
MTHGIYRSLQYEDTKVERYSYEQHTFTCIMQIHFDIYNANKYTFH